MITTSCASALTVIGHVFAKPGKEQALRNALLDIVAPTLADPGNRGYVLHVNTSNEGEFLLVEHWKDEAALALHKQGDDYQRFFQFAKAGDLIDGTPKETHWQMLTIPDVATIR